MKRNQGNATAPSAKLAPALVKLSKARDFLQAIEKGDSHGFDAQDAALFSRAVMDEGARELEQALFDLGHIEWKRGMFVDQLSRK